MQNYQLRLNALLMEDLFESEESLAQRVGWHYSIQVVQSMYRLIGSLELLGNPASFFSDVAGGVKQFYYEPRNGLVKSPAAFAHGIFSGTTGLASGVVGGTGNLLGGAANAAFSGLSNITGMMSLDREFNRKRLLIQQEDAAKTTDGLVLGAQALGDGLVGGVTGLFTKPVAGALDGGAAGLMKGLTQGLVGAVVKPLSGVATFASKTTRGSPTTRGASPTRRAQKTR